MLTDEAKEFLIKKGSNLDFGARPLRRAIENFVEDPLSEELLKGEFQGKDTITVEVKEVGDKKQLVFHGTTGEAAGRAATRRRRGRRYEVDRLGRQLNCRPNRKLGVAVVLPLPTVQHGAAVQLPPQLVVAPIAEQ